MMVRILIGDDHPLFRRGIKDLMTEAFAHVEIGETENGQEMLALAQARPWDMAVMDIMMPGRCGPELLADLKRACPSLPVLILTTHPEEQFAIRMVKAGASGYLTKAAATTELIEAIKVILAGRKYINASVGEQLAATMHEDSSRPPHQKLSDREYLVMCMLASGKSLKEIAGELCVSANTVSTYRTRILGKMRMKTNAELTSYAIRHSLVKF